MFRPLADRILVRRKQIEEKTKSGFYIPDEAKEKPQAGEVISVGPGKWVEGSLVRYPMDVAIGEIIYFGKYTGTEITIQGEDFLILGEGEILGKDFNEPATAIN